MNVIVQPGDGIELLLSGIKNAKKSIEIVIFRIDQSELEVALEEAVVRGVHRQPEPAETRTRRAPGSGYHLSRFECGQAPARHVRGRLGGVGIR